MSSCTVRLRSPSPVAIRCTTSGSAMIAPTVLRGFSDEYGSWKIICMSRRSRFSGAPFAAVMSAPSNATLPLVGSSRRSMRRAVVLLPQPVSPTMPSVSPRRTSSETPSTAWTAPSPRPRTPRDSGKCLTRSRISTRLSGRAHRRAARPRRAPPRGACRRAARATARAAARSPAGMRPRAGARPAPLERRLDRRGGWAHVRAARMKRAAGRQVDEARRLPRDRHELAARSRSSVGIDPSRPHVYGCSGAAKRRAVGPRSTIRPAYITATSSLISATIPRSWVMTMTAIPSSSFSRTMSSRICACTVTSSAVVGSSAIKRRGAR